jgi:hypothetical protein
MHNAPPIVEIGGAPEFQSSIQSGGPGIRTLMSLRTPVFKTGAIAILPTLLRASLVRLRCCFAAWKATASGHGSQGRGPCYGEFWLA